MKKTVDDKLNDAFEILPAEIKTNDVSVQDQTQTVVHSAVTDDYEYARQNLKIFIEKGKEAMDNIIYLAKEGESPRAYEVVGQLIKTLTDTNKDLLNLAKSKKEIETDKEDEKNPTHVTNALFVGSTAELQKLLNKK